MISTRVPAAMLAGVLMVAPIVAQAQVVQDQSAVVPSLGNVSVVSPVGLLTQPDGRTVYRSGVQSFTAGTSGILDHLDFQAGWATPPLDDSFILSLYNGDYAAGTATLLYTAVGALSSLPSSTSAYHNGTLAMHFDVRAANYAVTPGQRYSVMFNTNPSLAGYNLIIGYGSRDVSGASELFGSNYSGGAFQFITNGIIAPAGIFDVGFRSYVDISAVPEPTGWALMILGFGATGAVMRRRALGSRRTVASA